MKQGKCHWGGVELTPRSLWAREHHSRRATGTEEQRSTNDLMGLFLLSRAKLGATQWKLELSNGCAVCAGLFCGDVYSVSWFLSRPT